MQDSATELHTFVKLAIAYIGIMTGFAVLGLVFYVIAARGEAAGSVPIAPMMYYAAVSYYVALAGASVMTVWLLKNGRRAGAYLTFALLTVSLLAPVNSPAFGGMFTVIYWFAIPNAAVGLLLLKAARTLR
ncbi:hypothetical protein [Candidatus Nitrososphaera sp. FF02]|uniref:hypothetical protein n=1 Tax=Candidatus Nitrososphaera sp. FF02 TaxID=3398226 RepID=UPI0039EA3A99